MRVVMRVHPFVQRRVAMQQPVHDVEDGIVDDETGDELPSNLRERRRCLRQRARRLQPVPASDRPLCGVYIVVPADREDGLQNQI